MLSRLLVLGMVWLGAMPGRSQEPPAAPPTASQAGATLDGGLLEPAWFGPDPIWSRDWRADYFWVRPGVRWDRPVLYLRPWEEPRFLSSKDVLSYATGWEAAEYVQDMIRTRLQASPGIQLAASPEATPYCGMGRIVEATHIRQGALATLGPMAGLPTFTWDFKIVDVRTGETLLASHNRSVGAPASTWFTTLEAPLRKMAGLPPVPSWEMPADSQAIEGKSRRWVAPGLRLPLGSLRTGAWSADADSGGLNKAWSSGMGTNLAAQTAASLQDRLVQSGLARAGEGPTTYYLAGQVFSSFRFLKPRYRAWLSEGATGKVVARFEILAPFSLKPGEAAAGLIAAQLEALRDVTLGVPGFLPPPPPEDRPPPSPGPALAPRATDAWEGLERLHNTGGTMDKAWVSPALELRGRTLHVADWGEVELGPEADGHDRLLAAGIALRAPAWLFGALAWHQDRRFRISRSGGDLRLEGRVVRLYQPDPGNFGTSLAAGFTFGLAMKSTAVLQIRLLDGQSGETLALAEQELVSFQMASDGVPYKAMKWLAQDLAPWLLTQEGPLPGALDGTSKSEVSPSLPRP